MATSLERVGVKVRRTTTTATVSADAPILRPYVVGPCYEIVPLYSGTALNSDALLSVPARTVGTVAANTVSLRTTTFNFVANYGAVQTVTFPTNLTTLTYLISYLNANTTGVVFSLVDNAYVAIESITNGDSSAIDIRAGTANAFLGFISGDVVTGAGTYKNYKLAVAFTSLPDPRSNISYLSFDYLTDQIAAYYRRGGNILKFEDDAATLMTYRRHEFVEHGTNTEYGFPYYAAPVDDYNAGWDFAGDGSDQRGLGVDSIIGRGLVPQDDSDGDTTTAYVRSGGAAASNTGVHDKPAYAVIDIDTGSTNDTTEMALIILESQVANLPGYLGNQISYIAEVGVALTDAFVVTGDGVSVPWTITHTYVAAATLADIEAAIDVETTTVPGSGALSGVANDLTIAECIQATIHGDSTLAMQDMTDAIPLIGGLTAGLTVSGATSGRFGSLGNYLTFASTIGSTGTAAVNQSGGAGTSLINLRTWTLDTAAPVAADVDVALTTLPETAVLTLQAAESATPTWPGPYHGANGDDLITFEVSADSYPGANYFTVTVNRDTDKSHSSIDIAYYLCGVAPVEPTVEALRDAINADPVVGQLIFASATGAFTLVTVGDGDVYVTIGTTTTGTDPTTVAQAISAIDGDGAASLEIDASQGGGRYDSTCPIQAITSTQLTGGWDPIDFQAMDTYGSSDFAHARIVGEIDLASGAAVSGLTLSLRICGGDLETVTFAAGDAASGAAIAARINGTNNTRFGAEVASLIDGMYLKLTSQDVSIAAGDYGRRGLDSNLEIVGGTAIPVIFGTAANYTGIYTGFPLSVAVGDSLYDSGVSIGTIIDVQDYSIGTHTFPNAVLRLDTEISTSATYDAWHIRAENINFSSDNALATPVRPLPEMYVDTANELVWINAYVARDSGVPASSPTFTMYATYQALRQDLTNGIVINSSDDLDGYTPHTASNPLGFALYNMWAAGGGMSVYGYGVTEVSDDEVNGTYDAYYDAMNYLAGLDVYAIAPLTNAKSVIDLYQIHVETMSSETRKSERILIACPDVPDRDQPKSWGSGTAEQADTTTITFDENDINVVSVMSDIGISGVDLTSEDAFFDAGVYIDIASDGRNYLVASVSGQSVTVQTTGGYWESNEGNEDGFYAETTLPTMLTGGETCTIFTRGAAIASTEAQATSMYNMASGYNSIRVRIVGPDEVEIPISGVATRVNGYFLCPQAAVQACKYTAPTPLTGQTIPSISGVYHPVGMTDYEMGIAAAGGYSLAIVNNNTVIWRDFLTTKTSPIEDFEHSMITPDDVAARMFRAELKPYVGPLAIDNDYLTRVGVVADAVASKLVNFGIYEEAAVTSLTRDADDPRQLIVELDRTVFYPARGILIILV